MKPKNVFINLSGKGHSVFFFLMSAVVLVSSAQAETVTVLGTGYSCEWGSPDCNPCVPDVRKAFDNVKKRGEVMGFRKGSFSFDNTVTKHWQGIQRMMAGDGRYLVLTRSHASLGAVDVIRIDTRTKTGRWFGSNRQSPNASWSDDVIPPASDKVVDELKVEHGYNHASGLQAIGNYVVVAIERGSGNSKVEFYKVFDNPTKLNFQKLTANTMIRTNGANDQTGNNSTPPNDANGNAAPGQAKNAGAVAVTRLGDLPYPNDDYNGRYIMAVCGHDCDDLDFYVSDYASLETPGGWVQFDTISSWPDKSTFEDFQNINFVNQCNGDIYLAAFGKDISHDEVELWKVTITNKDPGNVAGLEASLTHVKEYHKICDRPGASRGNQCNFAAGAGSYVDPHRRIIVYAVEHEDDGPNDSIKFEEFRPKIPNACYSDYSDSWVELFDDKGADESDRSIIITYRDWYYGLRDYSDFDKVDGFEDKTSSFSYCVTGGAYFSLYEDKNYQPAGQSPEDQFTVQGIGGVGYEFDFDYSCGILCWWGDEVSSFKFRNKGPPSAEESPRYADANYPNVWFEKDWLVTEPASGTLNVPIKVVRSGTAAQLNQTSTIQYCDANWAGYVYPYYGGRPATPDVDYVATDCASPRLITFLANETIKAFDLVINSDSEAEASEVYIGFPTSTTANVNTVMGVPIQIKDFNNPVGGTVSNFNSESDSYTNNVGTTVYWRSMKIENTSNGDYLWIYEDGDFTMPIPLIPGAAYNIVVTDSAGYGCTVTNGTGTMGSVPITNVQVDCARVATFSVGESSFQEGAGGGEWPSTPWHKIRIELDGPASQNITIPYTLSGSAYHIWNPGQGTGDYYINPIGQADEVTILADTTYRDISVWVEDDADPEGDETLTITLGTPSAGAIFDETSIASHTLTINDDDSVGLPVYSFGSDLPATGMEPAANTTYNLAVVLNEPNSKNIVFVIKLESGTTATIPDDFEFTGANVGIWDPYKGTARVTIPAGSTSINIGVNIKPDALVEGTEDIVVDIAAPGNTPDNATYGAPTVHTFGIIDDDSPAVPFHVAVDVQGLKDGDYLEVYSPSISYTSTIVENGVFTLPYEYYEGNTWSLGLNLFSVNVKEQQCQLVLNEGESLDAEGFLSGTMGTADVVRTISCGDVGGVCFIASAAFGSPLVPQVELLREFRDRYLFPHAPGRTVVQFYYAVSPPVAELIARSETLRGIVRVGLIPIIGWASLVLWSPSLGLGIPLVVFGFGTWLVVRVARRRKWARPRPVALPTTHQHHKL